MYSGIHLESGQMTSLALMRFPSRDLFSEIESATSEGCWLAHHLRHGLIATRWRSFVAKGIVFKFGHSIKIVL